MLRFPVIIKNVASVSQRLTFFFGALSIGLLIGLSIQLVQAWTNPTATPPGGNVSGPINTGAASQTKAGVLGVGGGLVVNGWDAKLITVDTAGRYAEIIGTYQGWDANAIYIGGYNTVNGGPGYATNKVIVGGPGSSLPLYVTGGLSVASGGAFAGSGGAGIVIGGNSLSTAGGWVYVGDSSLVNAYGTSHGLAANNLWANDTVWVNNQICLQGDCRTAWPTLSGSYLPLSGGTMDAGAVIWGAGRLHISSAENTYILSRGGNTIISSAWGGGANLIVDGGLNVGGYAHFTGYGTDTWFPYTNGWNYLRGPTNLANVLYDEQNNGYRLDLNGDSNVWALYRAYGFNGPERDGNDGNYYVDPNGATVLNRVQANTFYYPSDETLKKDIVTLPHALEDLNSMRGVSFRWKKDDSLSIGVIAQEVEKVYPELVHTDEKGLKSVQYGNLVGPIIQAIKELSEKVEGVVSQSDETAQELLEQSQKIAEQEQRIEQLQKSVEMLQQNR